MSGKPIDAEDIAVLRRLQAALPDVGLNGWILGVLVLDRVIEHLTAAQQQGQAVEFEGTDREVLREFIRMCREDKPVGQWPGERVCAAIERSMANERPFRFIAEADMAPEREPSMKDADRALSGPRRNTAPPPSVPDVICPNCDRPTEIHHCQACGCDFAAAPPSAPVGVKTLSEFMAEQEALHPGIHDKVQAATDELRASLVQQPAAVDGAYPTPRNRAEAVALARLVLAHLGVIDAHIDAAIARCETNSATQHKEPTT